MPRLNPPELRCRVLGLVEAGRPVKQVTEMLGISSRDRRYHRRDQGGRPGCGLAVPQTSPPACSRSDSSARACSPYRSWPDPARSAWPDC